MAKIGRNAKINTQYQSTKARQGASGTVPQASKGASRNEPILVRPRSRQVDDADFVSVAVSDFVLSQVGRLYTGSSSGKDTVFTVCAIRDTIWYGSASEFGRRSSRYPRNPFRM